MNLTKLVRNLESQLKQAEKLARQYDVQAGALRSKLATVASAVGQRVSSLLSDGGKPAGRGRRMSAAGRARIAAAQKKRWAAFHAGKGGKAAAKNGAPRAAKKRRMSAAGRARIIAAQKKRWAAVRAGKAKK